MLSVSYFQWIARSSVRKLGAAYQHLLFDSYFRARIIKNGSISTIHFIETKVVTLHLNVVKQLQIEMKFVCSLSNDNAQTLDMFSDGLNLEFTSEFLKESRYFPESDKMTFLCDFFFHFENN